MTISGAGFTKGSTVKLTRGPVELSASQVVIMSATQIHVTVQVPSDAVNGPYDLMVVNSEGQAGMFPGAVTIGGDNAPILIMLFPQTMYAGATASFTLVGNRFLEGAMVVFENTMHESLSPDDTNVTTRKITGTLTVPKGAATGTWGVTVINPGGERATLRDALTVLPQPGGDEAGPTIASVKPASGAAGKTVGLIILGQNFTKGSSVTLTNHAMDILASQVVILDQARMLVVVKIPSTATPGTYDLVVKDSRGHSGTIQNAFTITPGLSAPK